MKRHLVLVLSVALMVGACTSGGPQAEASPLVVATTSILGDITSEIVGEAARVEILLEAGADPHDFQLSASQAALLRDAVLVVANGLGLEEGLEDALRSAASEGVAILEVAPSVSPIPFGREGPGESVSHEDSGLDPHFWHDPLRMAEAVKAISDALSELGLDVRSNSQTYLAQLAELDTELLTTYESIPSDRRTLVTNHDSFGYLAARYDLTVVGVVIPGGSTLAEPSSAELAELVTAIQEAGVPAIFVEASASPALAEAVAAEVGRPVSIVTLYSDSLGVEGSGVETYMDLMRYNARQISDALRP